MATALEPLAVTPYRQTHVVIDENQTVLLQPAVSFERLASQMCRTSSKQRDNVQLRPGIGWQIKHYGDIPDYAFERTVAQDSWLSVTAGTLTVASGVDAANRARKVSSTEITGMSPASSVATSSAPYHRRLWKDTDDVSTLTLASDSTAFPGPTDLTTDPAYAIDRIAVSVEQFNEGDNFVFNFDLPGVKVSTPDEVGRFSFPAPASTTEQTTGRGEYCARFFGTGRAVVEERLLDSLEWEQRFSFQYSTPQTVFGHHHTVAILSSKNIVEGGGAGGAITFRCGNFAQVPHGVIGAVLETMYMLTTLNDSDINQQTTYQIPRFKNPPPTNYHCQLRVDLRRDLRGAEFAIARPKFVAGGVLTDDHFKLNGLSIGSQPLFLQWYVDMPTVGDGGTGATFDIKLYSVLTGLEVPSPTTIDANTKSYPNPGIFTDPITGEKKLDDEFYIVATFGSSDNRLHSPTLTSYKVYRNAVGDESGTTEYEIRTSSAGGKKVITLATEHIDITGAEKDITHSTAMVHGVNLLGGADSLTFRSGMPLGIWTAYDATDATKKCWLFDGYVDPTDTSPVTGGARLSGFPAANAYFMQLQCQGKWKRLKEQSFQIVQQLFQHGDGSLWRVTEMVHAILNYAGFQDSEIDVPDDPMLLYGKGGSNFFGTDPRANHLDIIQQLLFDYLGWFLVWDRNLGDTGKWRALPQVRAPYTNVCAFISGPPPQNDGNTRIVSFLPSYPLASTLSDGLTYTDAAPTGFINKGTIQNRILPPEGNLLYCSTISGGTALGVKKHQTIVRPNYKSYNFDPAHPTADPAHRDFLGRCVPIYYLNPSLLANDAQGDFAGNALARIWRRIFDIACHAVDIRTFEAPLMIIDNEAEDGKKRILRYYDPVSIDGEQFVVRSCSPSYEKDSVQMAMYQCERPNF